MSLDKNNDSKAIFINILLSVIGMILNMGINMVLTPYITSNIGVEGYGFIILSNTVINYAEVISVALNSMVARFISVEYYSNNLEKVNQYYSSVLIANIVLSGFLMTISGILVFKLERIINIPTKLVVDVKILFILVAINYVITLIGTTFNVAAFIQNRLDITSRFKNISYVIKAAALFLLFTFGSKKIWQVPVATILASIFFVYSSIVTTKKLTPALKFVKKNYSSVAVKEILKNGIWNSINNFGVMLNSGLDLVVTNILLNATAMGQLSVTKNISSIFNTFIALFAQAFRPVQLISYSQNNITSLLGNIKLSIKVTGFICGLVFAGFFSIGHNFLSLWIPEQDTQLIYCVLIVVLVGDAIGAITYPLTYVFTITKRLKTPSIINIINGLINVFSMIVLLRVTNWGIYAVVITTSILNIVVQFIICPILACKCLAVDKMAFAPPIFSSLFNSAVLTVVFKIISSVFFQIQSWSMLFICACFLMAIGSILSFVMLFSREERKYLLDMIKSKLVKWGTRNASK